MCLEIWELGLVREGEVFEGVFLFSFFFFLFLVKVEVFFSEGETGQGVEKNWPPLFFLVKGKGRGRGRGREVGFLFFVFKVKTILGGFI